MSADYLGRDDEKEILNRRNEIIVELKEEVEKLKDENHDLKHDMMCSNNDRNELYLKERAKRKKLEGDLITAKNVIKEFKSMAKDSKELDELEKGLEEGVRVPREWIKPIKAFIAGVTDTSLKFTLLAEIDKRFTPETPTACLHNWMKDFSTSVNYCVVCGKTETPKEEGN